MFRLTLLMTDFSLSDTGCREYQPESTASAQQNNVANLFEGVNIKLATGAFDCVDGTNDFAPLSPAQL